ncbi:hypothetical protein MSAN_00644700 [Mycena sanguinolenta]|uniref:Tetraspanin n=1 Tax=Mycena sanguinolenta TaxID=230812 RepID=A0A8H6Z421_9AGAR|nr:hypothetical protein MSAN_00644700 [Mycena sanguinolenta]
MWSVLYLYLYLFPFPPAPCLHCPVPPLLCGLPRKRKGKCSSGRATRKAKTRPFAYDTGGWDGVAGGGGGAVRTSRAGHCVRADEQEGGITDDGPHPSLRFAWMFLPIAFSRSCLAYLAYTLLSLGALIITLFIHLSLASGSAVLTANSTALTLSTLAASAALFTSVFGWAGVMLNNRSILAFYCLFLWVSFGLLVMPGYVTDKEYSLNLQGKLNFAWSEDFDVDARREIQNALGCCGYFSPFVEASISARCYARSVLPGCKGPFFQFEHKILYRWFTIVFSLAGFDIMITVASLLCNNHVTSMIREGDDAEAGVVGEGYEEEAAERFIEANSRPGLRMHSRAASALDLHDTQQGGVDLSGMQMQELGAGTGTMESMGLTASSTSHSVSASSIWGCPTTPSALAQMKCSFLLAAVTFLTFSFPKFGSVSPSRRRRSPPTSTLPALPGIGTGGGCPIADRGICADGHGLSLSSFGFHLFSL